ncbi:insulinase family protein, partial [Veronia pacifica]
MKKKVTSQKVLKAEEAKTQWICHSDSGIRHWHQAEVAGYAAALVFFTPSDDDSGVAHALEHMVLRGCEAFPESRHFFNLRCRLNLDEFNATTQPETTRFHLSGDNLDAAIEGLHFFVESGLSPLLDQTAFAGEVWHTDIDGKTRGALYQEMCGYAAQPTFADAVSLVCDCHCRPALYGGMPDTIPQLTLNHLRHYHRRFYRPDNVLLLTRGDWPLDDIGKLLSRAVTRWQRRTDSEKYRDVPEPIFHYRPKRRQVIDVPTSPVWAAILATELTRDHHQIQLRQRQLQLQAVTSDFLCWPRLRFSYCDKNEQNCHEKNNHEEENNEKENNEKENIAVVALQPWLEGIARRIPVRRQQWQWRYFAMQQGSLVARRWGDSLQRLYQCAARDPDIPNVLRSTTINLAPLCRDTTPAKHGEFLADCPAITRLAIICRVPDRYHNQSVAAWLVHCQQATLRWTW